MYDTWIKMVGVHTWDTNEYRVDDPTDPRNRKKKKNGRPTGLCKDNHTNFVIIYYYYYYFLNDFRNPCKAFNIAKSKALEPPRTVLKPNLSHKFFKSKMTRELKIIITKIVIIILKFFFVTVNLKNNKKKKLAVQVSYNWFHRIKSPSPPPVLRSFS